MTEVQEVFDYWVEACGKQPSRVKLGDKRRRIIKKAIDLYGADMCIQAINGVTVSPFHQGENSRGKTYDDIALILRDEEHIEMFADIAERSDPIEEWLQA